MAVEKQRTISTMGWISVIIIIGSNSNSNGNKTVKKLAEVVINDGLLIMMDNK